MHGNQTMNDLKILLFIVEGSTDKVSLEPAIYKLVSNQEVEFYITNGDTLSDTSVKVDIATRIKQVVNDFLFRNKFQSNDICEIVQIVDLDGAFSPNSVVSNGNVEKTEYYDNKIICKYKQMFIKTKSYKMSNLLHLIALTEIKISNKVKVPYSLYYMSCNLEHTLHNKPNCTIKEKIEYSKVFAKKYNDPIKFEQLFNSIEIKIEGTYKETREYVQQGTNSLKRGSNFWICIDYLKNKSIVKTKKQN